MYRIRNNELVVISLFRGDYHARFYLREMSRLTKIPLKTCQDTLAYLERMKVLKSRNEGKNKYFSLNLQDIRTKLFLLQAEIYQTDRLAGKYPELKTFLKSLRTTRPIIVFGSFARLKADERSDLDMVIVSDKRLDLPFHLLPVKTHPIYLTERSFMKALKDQEDLIKEVEESHVILNNHSFYMDAMWRQYGP